MRDRHKQRRKKWEKIGKKPLKNIKEKKSPK
jgi:hypothetical protein